MASLPPLRLPPRPFPPAPSRAESIFPSRMELDKHVFPRAVMTPDPTPAPPRSSYTPQFSKSNAWILHRIKSGLSSALQSDSRCPLGSDKGRSQHYSRSRSSTVVMPKPRQAGTSEAPIDVSKFAMRFIHSPPSNLKRKRDSDSPEPDFTQNTIPFKAPPVRATPPPQSLPASPASSSGDGFQACVKCSSSLSTPSNVLIVCHGCSNQYHQECLSTTAAAGDANPLCQECEDEGPNTVAYRSTQGRRSVVERLRENRLASLPPDVVPAKPELVGFLARQATDVERTQYFLSRKKTDLLNILSLCDQLKPQLLVDVLVSVTKKHPDLPIFDDPEWKSLLPGATPTTARLQSSTNAKARARHGHAVLDAKAASRKVKGSRKVLKRVTVLQKSAATTAPDNESDAGVSRVGEVEVSLPPTWPKPGEGLYSKLPPETDDRRFLEDDDDDEAFSHFMVDKFGNQLAVQACA
ncbi:hypothetical protein DCS_05609 [Drechmeria coniospora]|uniref:PHD-type domain-containing protein n=1 Tax=Drechmeria coniospora TaxID=98403 RepID=A0A151GNM1_DRECN|nr:hypothetical protein DCS_05609 [Drechmeria coniospora]KYK58592.1 hypothetical protein DCS_05609 [Drechmeria coniospora]